MKRPLPYNIMTPISPVVKEEFKDFEIVIAKDQPEYIPLPAIIMENGQVISHWKLTLWERIKVLLTGSLWLEVLTFGRPLQPIAFTFDRPKLKLKIYENPSRRKYTS